MEIRGTFYGSEKRIQELKDLLEESVFETIEEALEFNALADGRNFVVAYLSGSGGRIHTTENLTAAEACHLYHFLRRATPKPQHINDELKECCIALAKWPAFPRGQIKTFSEGVQWWRNNK